MASLPIGPSDSLRKKAHQKFGDGNWWVTQRSLEQATAWQIASLKANWFGDDLVHDLCCGIGGDSVALARRGDIVALDSDPQLVEYVRRNLAQLQTPFKHSVRCCDVMQFELSTNASVHIDPDRRPAGKRTTRPDDYLPPLNEIVSRLKNSRAAIVKLAPAATIEIQNTHQCWLSLCGTVREQSMLFGETMHRAGVEASSVSAWKVNALGEANSFKPSESFRSEFDSVDYSAKPGMVLVDPDAAIRAAGLTVAYAAIHELKTLGGPAGFLTSDSARDESVIDELRKMSIVGRVAWIGSADDRKLRKEFRAHNWHAHAVKVRGTGHDPAVLTKRLRGCGEIPVTLWLGRVGGSVYAAVSVD